jgi:hypothetical protein
MAYKRNAEYIERGGYAQNGYRNQQAILPRPYAVAPPYAVDTGLPPDLTVTGSQSNVVPFAAAQESAAPASAPAEDTIITRTIEAFADRFNLLSKNGNGAQQFGNLNPVFDGMRYANFLQIPLLVGTADQLVLPQATNKRVYLFIINTHGAQDLFVNFGNAASLTASTPIRNGDGFFEWLMVVPQQDIHLIANGANTTGVLIYGELGPNAAEPATTPPLPAAVTRPQTLPPPVPVAATPILLPSSVTPADIPKLPSDYYVNQSGYIVRRGGTGTGVSYQQFMSNPSYFVNRLN